MLHNSYYTANYVCVNKIIKKIYWDHYQILIIVSMVRISI